MATFQEKELQSRYPAVEGTTAETTKQVGNRFLFTERSNKKIKLVKDTSKIGFT